MPYPYQPPYQPYQPYQPTQYQYQQPVHGFVYVAGIEGAKAYQMPPSSEMPLFHDALVEVMGDWVEWEDGTAETFRSAARRLWDMGETALAMKVNKLAESTEAELAEAKFLHNRLVASDWDVTIA